MFRLAFFAFVLLISQQFFFVFFFVLFRRNNLKSANHDFWILFGCCQAVAAETGVKFLRQKVFDFRPSVLTVKKKFAKTKQRTIFLAHKEFEQSQNCANVLISRMRGLKKGPPFFKSRWKLLNTVTWTHSYHQRRNDDESRWWRLSKFFSCDVTVHRTDFCYFFRYNAVFLWNVSSV